MSALNRLCNLSLDLDLALLNSALALPSTLSLSHQNITQLLLLCPATCSNSDIVLGIAGRGVNDAAWVEAIVDEGAMDWACSGGEALGDVTWCRGGLKAVGWGEGIDALASGGEGWYGGWRDVGRVEGGCTG